MHSPQFTLHFQMHASYSLYLPAYKKIGNITDSRAKFIARDQSAKLNASLTQACHEEMGITHYRWSASGDERVRDSHADKDGEIFAYAEPPEDTGHPGHDYNCRCVAIPVVDESEIIRQNISQMNNVSGDKIQMRSNWDDNFPDTIIDRKLGDATSHPLYQSAKSGNIEDAYQLAKDLVTDDAIQKLKIFIKGNEHNTIIVPVHAEESVGHNMIPIATATVIAKKLNLPVDLSIVQSTKVSRTGSDGWHRLIYSPTLA